MGNCKFAFTSLLLYCFGAHFITKMKYMPEGVVSYGLSLLLCLIFISCIKYSNLKNVSKGASAWIPYILITIIGYTVCGYYRLTALWIVALIIIGISQKYSTAINLPVKIIVWFGLLQVFGELFQLFFPRQYSSVISSYFGSDFKMFGSGLQGFTEQTAVLASTLLLFMGSLIYYKIEKKWVKLLVVIVIVPLIFMSGKRSFSVMAILIPVAVNVLSQKNSAKAVFALSLSVLFGVLFINYFIANAEQYQEIPGMRKIAETFSETQSEEDIMNGREILWAAALEGFDKNPILGIGTGRFMDWSGLPTNAHNAYLQVLCEQGIIGFLLFVVPLIVCLIQTILLIRKLPVHADNEKALKFSLFLQLFFIIYAFSGNPTRDENCFLLYFMGIGIMLDSQYKFTISNYENTIMR